MKEGKDILNKLTDLQLSFNYTILTLCSCVLAVWCGAELDSMSANMVDVAGSGAGRRGLRETSALP